MAQYGARLSPTKLWKKDKLFRRHSCRWRRGRGICFLRHPSLPAPEWLGSDRLASSPSHAIVSGADYAPFGEPYSTLTGGNGNSLSLGLTKDTDWFASWSVDGKVCTFLASSAIVRHFEEHPLPRFYGKLRGETTSRVPGAIHLASRADSGDWLFAAGASAKISIRRNLGDSICSNPEPSGHPIRFREHTWNVDSS